MSPRAKPALPRLMKKVQKDEATGCWNWLGCIDQCGYGRASMGLRTRPAYRVFYELLVGPTAPGLALDHLCYNTRCVNPAHLEPVTPSENSLRQNRIRGNRGGVGYAARTHCPRGHPYDAANTYVRANRNRQCRACRRIEKVEYRRRIRDSIK